jgi:cytochrome P450
VKRGDFIDKLKELHDDYRKGEGDRVLNENLIFAQGIGLFLAGFETTSNALATLAFNLAQNPEVQDRVYSEVQEVLKTHGGVIDHHTIAFMPYLEACINENLRICPPVTR